MAGLRRRFGLVALVVLVPVALLVWRALGSVALERAARHEIVAERVFDETERTLSDLLAREEERPLEAYGVGGDVPLRAGSDHPFVVGYFQIEPQGVIRGETAARAVVEAWWRGGGAREERAAVRPAVEGESRGNLDRDGKSALAKAGGVAEPKRKEEPSSYDALRSLNKAVEQRVARQKQMADEYAAPAESGRADDRVGQGNRGGDVRSHAAPAASTGLSRRHTAQRSLMGGHPADDQHLVLYRTVAREDREYRQGLVLHLPRLGAWLQTQVVGRGELAELATLDIGAHGPAFGPSQGEFAFSHRLAEPFDALTARVALKALPGVGGAGYVYALSGLLVAAMALGLIALYRMVAVAVGFAERRSNFVAAVSHELKTPLTAIRMYGEMLRDGMVSSEAKRDEYYRHITAESERLSRLINNVLEFAKLEKGSRAMALVVGRIEPVLDEAVTLLRPHVEAAGFSLRVEVEPGLPAARFERDALLQVLFNLVDNAVKYAAGAVRTEVVVQARRVGNAVVLSVRDHGPGVPAAQLEQIFEPFFRGERELTRRSKGTGLGLALVSGLASGMGATVAGRNVQDGGFEVELALATP
jgi:signal transduction histidine kinase